MTEPALRPLTRRFLLLTALRWFPGGLVLPVLVLLQQARGLELPTIGVLFAVFSLAVAILELPTGGLADVVGRRQVLLASSLLTTTAFALFAAARGTLAFAFAFLVFAVGRALSSGLLQAWYVDAVHHVSPTADLRPGLAREGLVTSVAIGIGAVVGGALPTAASRIWPTLTTKGDAAVISAAVPVWLAAALLLLATAMIAWLMTAPPVKTRPAARALLLDVPRTIASGLTIARRDRGAAAILLSVAAVGVAVAATELLAPTYFALLIDDPDRAAAVYGVLLTAVFVASGLGSAAAPLLARLSRGSSMRGAASAAAGGALGYLALGIAAGLVAAVVAYIVVYAFVGGAEPLRIEQLHQRVGPEERATVLSVESMAQMLGGVIGSLAVPQLVDRFGPAAGWYACAAALLAASLLTVRTRDQRPGTSMHLPKSTPLRQ